MITREDWLRLRPIVEPALSLTSHQVPAYLDRACLGDAELRRTAEELIRAVDHAPDAPVAATAMLLRYTYPGRQGPHDYDYNELLLSASFVEHYAIELGYTDDLYGYGASGHHWEFQLEWPFANAWVASAARSRAASFLQS